MTHKIKLIPIFLFLLSFVACSNEESNSGKNLEAKPAAKEMTISGVAEKIDAANFSYEIDKSKITPSTRITEIIINK